jgi:UDP-N-acetylglucosamine--N-acetylmuramyl-(pentapeptide) pyrophosphoryl-undecaprenol N-acetylglucosamine transferase
MAGLVPAIHALLLMKKDVAARHLAGHDVGQIMAKSEAKQGRLILLCAGGTGGHLFPAEALAVALEKRGTTIDLATDTRAAHFKFPARAVHVIPSATLRGRDPLSLARTATLLAVGTLKAWALIGRIRPAVVVGFGGYPTVPPLYAASLRGVPTVLHEQNGVMGRANRLLASRVTTIATGFRTLARLDSKLQAKIHFTGNPVRLAVIEAAATPFVAPAPNERLNLLVFGGSQGAHVMAEIVPAAVERLAPEFRARLSIVQQARAEDLEAVRAIYGKRGVAAECAPFFADLPARMAAAHLVVSRSGASTVAELSAIGRPAVLVPLPHALDQDQLANAGVLAEAGGAIRIEQRDFTPQRLADEIAALAADPARLTHMAQAAKAAGAVDAAERLADLVMKVAAP